MKSAMDVVHDLITSYTGSEVHCLNIWETPTYRHSCDSMVLGSLIKAAAEIGFWPRLQEPDPHMTFEILLKRIRNMKILYGSSCDHTLYNYNLAVFLNKSMNTVEASLSGGLNLEDFLPKARLRLDCSLSSRDVGIGRLK